MGTVLSRRPSPICFSFAQSVTLPPKPRFGRVDLEEHLDGHVTTRNRLSGHLPIELDAQEGVGVVQQTLFVNPERVAAGEVSVGDDDTLGAAFRHLQFTYDRVQPPWIRGVMPRWTFCTSPMKLNRVIVGSGGRMPYMTEKRPPSTGAHGCARPHSTTVPEVP